MENDIPAVSRQKKHNVARHIYRCTERLRAVAQEIGCRRYLEVQVSHVGLFLCKMYRVEGPAKRSGVIMEVQRD